MVRFALTLAVLGLVMNAPLRAGEIGFAEEFALAKDRTEALKKLIPGTEDYYYYHCLHLLNSAQYDKAAGLFKPWFEKFQQSARLTELQTRHALLSYELHPQASLDYFKTRLGLRFDHQKIVQGGAPNLPTSLDPKSIGRDTLAAFSKVRWQQNFDNYENSALDWLMTEKLDSNLRRHMLARLTRPDVPNLVKLIAADLNTEGSGGFGTRTRK